MILQKNLGIKFQFNPRRFGVPADEPRDASETRLDCKGLRAENAARKAGAVFLFL